MKGESVPVGTRRCEQFNYRECQPHCLMCPSQLIQGEDVIIYESMGLGRLFCRREKEGGDERMKKEIASQNKEVHFGSQPIIWSTSVSHKRIKLIRLEILSKYFVLPMALMNRSLKMSVFL